MLTPQAGLAFMKQMQQLQQPGGTGIGAPAAGSPTQGLIARMMSDNPGGLIGALMKQNDQNQPGSIAGQGMALPAQPGAAAPGGPPQVGMLAGLLAKLKGPMGATSGDPLLAPPPMRPAARPPMPPMMPPPDVAGGGMGGGGGSPGTW